MLTISAVLKIIPPKIEEFAIVGMNKTGDANITKTILVNTSAMTNVMEPMNTFII